MMLARVLSMSLLGVLAVAAPAAAAPGGIAYLKDKQVWVAKLDGSKKVQLSTGDAWWNAVGQSSSGGVVATKNEPGKIGQLSQFAIWNPDGTVKDQGPASPGTNFSGSLAVPLGLELTADNRGLVYGFSNYVYGYPVGTLTTGYGILPSTTRITPTSIYTNNETQWPSLAGGRVLATSGTSVSVEPVAGNLTGPFAPWFQVNLPSSELHRALASDDGRIVAVEVADNSSASPTRLLVEKWTGFLGTYVDDCWLPTIGNATSADVSPDGNLIAYTDDGGLKAVATPNLRAGGPPACELAGGPVTIDAAGSYPALGPIDVDALYAARNPPPSTPAPPGTPAPPTTPNTPTAPPLTIPGPGRPPAVTVPAGLTAGALAGSSARLQVAVGAKGKVTVVITVGAKAVGRKGKAVVIATGSLSAKKAGRYTLRLKATKAGRALKKKLKGKRVTVTVTAGGRRTAKTVTLR